ncbi:MAG: hypothetical protein DYH13_00660 [Alphaproteobacteria bacterium PRO2]|nr:hypothetical protein [Alphaproteobacteria bacterium PRO2]
MKRFIFVALILIAVPAHAEDVSTRTLCQMLPQYQADPSVNYTPGVDVHGKPVVPGDVNKVLRNNFDAVEIPVEMNLLHNLNVNAPAGTEIKPTVAVLKVYGDGRVKYNEQDVTQQAQNLCALRQPATPQNNAYAPPASSAQPIRQQVDAQLRHPSSYPPGSPERQAAMQNFQQQQPAAIQSNNPASLNEVAPAAGGQEPRGQEPLGKLPPPPPFEPINARDRVVQ